MVNASLFYPLDVSMHPNGILPLLRPFRASYKIIRILIPKLAGRYETSSLAIIFRNIRILEEPIKHINALSKLTRIGPSEVTCFDFSRVHIYPWVLSLKARSKDVLPTFDTILT